MRSLNRIAERLHRQASRLQGFELIAEREPGPHPLAPTRYEEISAALRLKEALLAEFAGARLEEFYRCSEVESEFGRFLHLESFSPQRPALLDQDHSYQVLSSQLRLLYGIGPVIEHELRVRGYRTLEDLADHPRFAREAAQLLGALRRRDLPRLAAQVERWFSASHPLTLALTGLVDGEFAFFDLESLGLFGRPLVLLGLARPYDNGLLIEQYVIRSITEELAALVAGVELLEEAEALVTYNGKAFDINYLEERLSYYGLSTKINRPSFDLLHHARRLFRDHLPDCRLETVERYILGRKRPLDIPSALVPDFYNTYLEEQNVGPLVAIIEHNKHDLISLAALLGKLCSDQ